MPENAPDGTAPLPIEGASADASTPPLPTDTEALSYFGVGGEESDESSDSGGDVDDATATEEVDADAARIVGFAINVPFEVLTVPCPAGYKGLVEMLAERKVADTPRVLKECSLNGFADHLRTCRNVVVMTGAGISCAAGIPDFRSKNGLYAQLGANNPFSLPHPESLFDIHFFKKRPHAFYRFCENLWPGQYEPTEVHKAIKTLQDKQCLRRVYTQNIDGLERQAGVGGGSLVEAHGNMESAHCVDCDAPYPAAFVKTRIDQGCLPQCRICSPGENTPLEDLPEKKTSEGETGTAIDEGVVTTAELPDIRGLVKPRITFFHEALPPLFARSVDQDLTSADALIIIGTSLTVAPFCKLPDIVPDSCPRILINNVGDVAARAGFVMSQKYGYRDVVWEGDCQVGVVELLKAAGYVSFNSISLKQFSEKIFVSAFGSGKDLYGV